MEHKDSTKMDVKGLCEYLHCGETTARNLYRTKAIPFYKVRGKYVFEKSAIDWWISNQYRREGWGYEVK